MFSLKPLVLEYNWSDLYKLYTSMNSVVLIGITLSVISI